MRPIVAIAAAAACAAVLAAPGGAARECKGLQTCIPVSGPWVVVHPGARSTYLLSCGKKGVVGGLDAVATASAVRVSFDGRIGSPVGPGVTTTQSAYFTGLTTRRRTAAFQPWIGCVPASGGGGRSTVSARVVPGPAIVRSARIVVVTPGAVKTGSVGCAEGEKLVGGWSTVAFRTKKPPDLSLAGLVHVARATSRGKVVVTVLATDALPIDAHAVVQVGAECAP